MALYIKENYSQKTFHRGNLFSCGSIGVVGKDKSPSTLIPVCNPDQVHRSYHTGKHIPTVENKETNK